MMKTAFLIEGGRKILDENFIEVMSAIKLAEANSAGVFDPIESYSKKQLAVLLERLPSEQHPLVAVMILVDFQKESSLQTIWNRLVKPIFEDNPPAWLINLTESGCNEFVQMQFQAHFGNAIDQYKLWAKSQHQIMDEISDQLSTLNFAQFLQENPEIEKIFALVGSAHKNFFSNHEGTELVEEHDCCRQFTMLLNQSTIFISLHHGLHGNLDHFISMQQSCREYGLVIPEEARGREVATAKYPAQFSQNTELATKGVLASGAAARNLDQAIKGLNQNIASYVNSTNTLSLLNAEYVLGLIAQSIDNILTYFLDVFRSSTDEEGSEEKLNRLYRSFKDVHAQFREALKGKFLEQIQRSTNPDLLMKIFVSISNRFLEAVNQVFKLLLTDRETAICILEASISRGSEIYAYQDATWGDHCDEGRLSDQKVVQKLSHIAPHAYGSLHMSTLALDDIKTSSSTTDAASSLMSAGEFELPTNSLVDYSSTSFSKHLERAKDTIKISKCAFFSAQMTMDALPLKIAAVVEAYNTVCPDRARISSIEYYTCELSDRLQLFYKQFEVYRVSADQCVSAQIAQEVLSCVKSFQGAVATSNPQALNDDAAPELRMSMEAIAAMCQELSEYVVNVTRRSGASAVAKHP